MNDTEIVETIPREKSFPAVFYNSWHCRAQISITLFSPSRFEEYGAEDADDYLELAVSSYGQAAFALFYPVSNIWSCGADNSYVCMGVYWPVNIRQGCDILGICSLSYVTPPTPADACISLDDDINFRARFLDKPTLTYPESKHCQIMRLRIRKNVLEEGYKVYFPTSLSQLRGAVFQVSSFPTTAEVGRVTIEPEQHHLNISWKGTSQELDNSGSDEDEMADLWRVRLSDGRELQVREPRIILENEAHSTFVISVTPVDESGQPIGLSMASYWSPTYITGQKSPDTFNECYVPTKQPPASTESTGQCFVSNL